MYNLYLTNCIVVNLLVMLKQISFHFISFPRFLMLSCQCMKKCLENSIPENVTKRVFPDDNSGLIHNFVCRAMHAWI